MGKLTRYEEQQKESVLQGLIDELCEGNLKNGNASMRVSEPRMRRW
jgi:hypothetical protein